jgi:phosphoribosylformylglycinamidine synthase
MSAARTAILYAPGTNCQEETAAALERAGGQSELVLLHDLIAGSARLDRFQAMIIPGGFAYGDHLGAGRVFATMLVAELRNQLTEFLEAGKPVLGICNGFQVLTEAGILPSRTPGCRVMALLENESARFEDRMVRIAVSEEPSPWTQGLDGRVLRMPSAHAEGRALGANEAWHAGARVAFRYCGEEGQPTGHYPENPSGAPDAVAGIADSTGRVLGLMPHPERAALAVHESQDGLELFKNLVRWLG